MIFYRNRDLFWYKIKMTGEKSGVLGRFDLKIRNCTIRILQLLRGNRIIWWLWKYGTKEMYQRSFNREISSILVNLKISPDEIKRIIIKLHAHQIL